MIMTANKTSQKSNLEKNHPLNRKFKTTTAAAKAKTDFLMETVFKDVDWSKVK
jgi:hypothetical protein